jgi:hypothetical protein
VQKDNNPLNESNKMINYTNKIELYIQGTLLGCGEYGLALITTAGDGYAV